MTFPKRVRGVPLVVSCLAALAVASGGCSSDNLVGEVHDDAGSVSGTPDAGDDARSDAGGGVDGPASSDVGLDRASGDAPDIAGDAGVDIYVFPDGGCPITYPATGFFGQNILVPQGTPFANGQTAAYTMAANVPPGYALTIKMTVLGGTGGSTGLGPVWLLSQSDYRMTTFDLTTHEQLFMATLPGVNEVDISFDGSGSARIDLYECGAPIPTRVETISWTM